MAKEKKNFDRWKTFYESEGETVEGLKKKVEEAEKKGKPSVNIGKKGTMTPTYQARADIGYELERVNPTEAAAYKVAKSASDIEKAAEKARKKRIEKAASEIFRKR